MMPGSSLNAGSLLMGGADEWLFSFTRDGGESGLQTGENSAPEDVSAAAKEATLHGVNISQRLC